MSEKEKMQGGNSVHELLDDKTVFIRDGKTGNA
jgi:hypothetical protein